MNNSGVFSFFKDLVVLELAAVLAGPSVGMFLAELGAKVIKVENPARGGDVTRSWKLPNEDPKSGLSAYYLSSNWGKRSLALDLKKEAGRDLIYQLIPKVDIVLVSYKPGDAEKLGMDYTSLSALNPQLIYAELTAYGPADPRPGFDAIIQAESGFTYMNGVPDGDPVKMPVALMDLLAAHQLKEGILVALIQRLTTGKGSKLSTSLLASGVASLANQASNYLNAGHIPQRMGSSHPNIVPYGTIYYTRDQKPVVLAIGNDRQFRLLCEILNRPDLSAHPIYQTNADRVKARTTLNAELQKAFSQFDRDPLLEQFAQLKVPAGPVLDLSEVVTQPEAQRLALEKDGLKGLRSYTLLHHPHPDELTPKPEPAAPRPLGELEPPPRMGQHTEEILHEYLQLTPTQLDQLKSDGIIHQSTQFSTK